MKSANPNAQNMYRGAQGRYVVVTDSRKRDEVLFMVDRRKQRKSFWSNSIHDALWYVNAAAAKAKADELKFNNPRVMTYEETIRYVLHATRQCLVEVYDEDTSYEDDEQGWDAHKNL